MLMLITAPAAACMQHPHILMMSKCPCFPFCHLLPWDPGMAWPNHHDSSMNIHVSRYPRRRCIMHAFRRHLFILLMTGITGQMEILTRGAATYSYSVIREHSACVSELKRSSHTTYIRTSTWQQHQSHGCVHCTAIHSRQAVLLLLLVVLLLCQDDHVQAAPAAAGIPDDDGEPGKSSFSNQIHKPSGDQASSLHIVVLKMAPALTYGGGVARAERSPLSVTSTIRSPDHAASVKRYSAYVKQQADATITRALQGSRAAGAAGAAGLIGHCLSSALAGLAAGP